MNFLTKFEINLELVQKRNEWMKEKFKRKQKKEKNSKEMSFISVYTKFSMKKKFQRRKMVVFHVRLVSVFESNEKKKKNIF